jgi:hypothetical protein
MTAKSIVPGDFYLVAAADKARLVVIGHAIRRGVWPAVDGQGHEVFEVRARDVKRAVRTPHDMHMVRVMQRAGMI